MNKNKIAKLWVLFIILAAVGSALGSGMVGAANKAANPTGDAPDGIVNNTLPNEISEINNS